MKIIKGDGFTVNIIKSNRRKTMALKVTKQGVTIHIPNLLPIDLAQQFVDQKSAWIKAKLHQQSQQFVEEKQFNEGDSFYILGEAYRLNLQDANTKPIITLNGMDIVCRARLTKITKSAIRAAFINWYKQQAQDYLNERCSILSQQTGLQAKSVTVKTYRARWGSCTLKGDIQFNWKLLMAPPDIIDYVIIHELCHTKHHNHSSSFWQLVAQHMPSYQLARNWLKKNGYALEF